MITINGVVVNDGQADRPCVQGTGEFRIWRGVTLEQIAAIRDIPQHGVRRGDRGGWVEDVDRNLSGNAWVARNGMVIGAANVSGNALVLRGGIVDGSAQVYGNAEVAGRVSDNARVFGNVIVGGTVSGNAKVYGNVVVEANATVTDNAEVFGNVIVGGVVCEQGRVYGNEVVPPGTFVRGNIKVPGEYHSSTRTTRRNSKKSRNSFVKSISLDDVTIRTTSGVTSVLFNSGARRRSQHVSTPQSSPQPAPAAKPEPKTVTDKLKKSLDDLKGLLE